MEINKKDNQWIQAKQLYVATKAIGIQEYVDKLKKTIQEIDADYFTKREVLVLIREAQNE